MMMVVVAVMLMMVMMTMTVLRAPRDSEEEPGEVWLSPVANASRHSL